MAFILDFCVRLLVVEAAPREARRRVAYGQRRLEPICKNIWIWKSSRYQAVQLLQMRRQGAWTDDWTQSRVTIDDVSQSYTSEKD